MNKRAIYCINCYYYRDDKKLYQVLGSVDMWGRLIVKRVHNMNTIISGTVSMTLTCDSCDYKTTIEIESDNSPHNLHESV